MLTNQAAAQTELYWDVNGAILGAGGTGPNALNGAWSTSANNWSTDAWGEEPTAGWIQGSNAHFTTSPVAGNFYSSFQATLGQNIELGNLMVYGWGQAGSTLEILNGASYTMRTQADTFTALIAPNLTMVINPSLSGEGDLVKYGEGTLVLSGTANSFTGATVDDGILEVKGATARLTLGDLNWFSIGKESSGTLKITDGAIVASQLSEVGRDALTLGKVIIGPGSAWNVTKSITIGHQGRGEVLVEPGGTWKTTTGPSIGARQGGFGLVTVQGTNAFWDFTGAISSIGAGGEGEVYIQNGARASGSSFFVGHHQFDPINSIYNPGKGKLVVSGENSTVTLSSGLSVGTSGGEGIVEISNKAKVTSDFGLLGGVDVSTSIIQRGHGTVTVQDAGSQWTVTRFLRVGRDATGVMNILNGGKVVSGSSSAIGYDKVYSDNSKSSGTVFISGESGGIQSEWQTTGSSFTLGDYGDGTLTLADKGRLTIGNGSGTLNVASLAGVFGTLNIGAYAGGTTAGTLNAGAVSFKSGTAVINFNQTDSSTFSAVISGNGVINQRGTGTTILSGNSTNTGSVNVTAGRLLVNGTLGSAAVTVGSGAILGGGGTIGGAVTIQNGGRLAPGNSPGTLTVAALTLNQTSILDYELGAPGGNNDFTAITGALTLDGILNINAQAGFGAGVYNIFSYGSLTANNGLIIGTSPEDFSYTVDLNTVGQVNLLVNASELQFWDGSDTTGIPGVQGGSGIWNNTSTNWTNASGSTNAAWNEMVAVFSGTNTPREVTLGENIQFGGMQFVTGGYVIEPGNGYSLMTSTQHQIRVDDTLLDTIFNAPLSGSGGINKTGEGRLILNGINDHAGDTHVTNGTLQVDGSITTSSVVVFDGATLAGSGDLQGTTTVLDGGIISPGGVAGFSITSAPLAIMVSPLPVVSSSIGTLTFGNLVLNETSILQFELGAAGSANNDLIEVINDLTLDGLVRITDAGGFGQGTYRLINFGGVLTDNGLTIGSVPLAVNPGDFTVDVSVPGEVNLIYFINPSASGYQYWDGSNSMVDGSINGGSGIWSSTNTNWTNREGNVNGPWASQTAVFGGAPGTVFLGSSVNFERLIFNTSGYQIVSPQGHSLQAPDNAEIEVNAESAILGAPTNIAGTFTKTGDGKLDLRAPLTAGNTVINSGSLAVNSILISPSVNVGSGGILMGNGTVIGNVSNSGTVAPGNSIGLLTIAGNYTQTRSGTLQIEAASARNHDVLVVTGTARLDGTLELIEYRGGRGFKYGDQIPFLRAGNIIGTFDDVTITDPHLNRGRFVNLGNVGMALIAPASYKLVAETSNQTRVAGALDQWIGIESGDIGRVTLALDLLREEQYPQAFEAIMPKFHEGALSTGIELSNAQGQMLHQYLSARRLGARANQAPAQHMSTVADSAKGVPSAKGGKYSKAVAPEVQAPLEEDYRVSTWFMGSGLFSSGGLSLNAGEDFESGTFLAGADYAISESFSLGLFAGYGEGWGDYDNGGQIDLERITFGGYATVDVGNFYLNAAVGGGSVDYDIKRPIQFATLDRTAKSDPDSNEFFALLGGGYDVQAGNWTFGPQASLQYSKVSVDSFTERGADSLNLRLHDPEMDSLRSYLGARVAYTIQASDRVAIIPEVRAFWQHEFLDGDGFRSSLNGGAGPDFNYDPERDEKDSFFIGAGIGLQVGARFYANLYYNADLGREEPSHNVSISATLKF